MSHLLVVDDVECCIVGASIADVGEERTNCFEAETASITSRRAALGIDILLLDIIFAL